MQKNWCMRDQSTGKSGETLLLKGCVYVRHAFYNQVIPSPTLTLFFFFFMGSGVAQAGLKLPL